MKYVLLLLGLTFSLTSSSQVNLPVGKSINSLSRAYGWNDEYYTRRSIGVYPEIQFIRSPVIAVSASLARFVDGEGVYSSRGVNLGLEFDPIQKFYGPKVAVWGDIFARFIGCNASLSMM